MDPITLGLLIGGGGGLVKSLAVDGPREARQRRLAAQTQRYSPWTGLEAQPIQEADPLGTAIGMGAAGGQIGGNIQSMQAQAEMNKKFGDWLSPSKGLSSAQQSQLDAPVLPAQPATLNYPRTSRGY
jgi:hypothetical protein